MGEVVLSSLRTGCWIPYRDPQRPPHRGIVWPKCQCSQGWEPCSAVPRFSIFPNPSGFESITNLVAFYLLIKFSLLRILPSENPSPEISGEKTWKRGPISNLSGTCGGPRVCSLTELHSSPQFHVSIKLRKLEETGCLGILLYFPPKHLRTLSVLMI